MKRTIIIAEIGENFIGSIKMAKGLMQTAKEVGCDYAKFQLLDIENISADDPERDWFYKIALDKEIVHDLIEFAKEIEIKILFSPENLKIAKWLKEEEQLEIKIASSCITDLNLIDYINKNFNRVFMSTGMASLEEIQKSVEILSDIETLFIMHCISEYPTGPLLEMRGLKPLNLHDVHLKMMLMLKNHFPRFHIGYSDHTAEILVPLVAVSMGAEVIEKHITLDRKTPIKNLKEGKEYLGTDHVFSLEPDEFKEMICTIREIEIMLGDWKWERSKGEMILKDFLRGRFHNQS